MDSCGPKNLGEICIINPKKSELRKLSNELEVSFVPMNELIEDKQSFDSKIIKPLNEVYKGYTYFQNNDVVLAKVTPCFENGKVGIATNLKNNIGFGSSEFHILRPKENISAKWIYYSLKTGSFIHLAKLSMIGAGGLKRVPTKFIENWSIFVPSFTEQKRIARKLDSVFDKIDKSILLLEENLKHSKALILSIIDEEFKKIALSVNSLNLTQLVKKDKHSIKRGPFGSALKKSFFVSSGYKVYEQKNAIKNDFSIGDYYIDEEKFKELVAFEVKSGDIIISCSGTIGKIAIAPPIIKKGIINQALLKISLDNNKILSEYFALFFENFVNQGELESKGAAIKNIVSVSELKQIPIPTPSKISDQKAFIQNVKNKQEVINNSIREIGNKLNNLKALKSSLLDQAFKGEL